MVIVVVEKQRLGLEIIGKRSVKDACRRSLVGAMMRHGEDSKGSVHYRVGGH
jgi:hypothetical protein